MTAWKPYAQVLALMLAALAALPARADYAVGQAAFEARNYKAAAAEWAAAADAGDARAQVSLAQMYERGQGVPEDPLKAVALYRKAAEQGFANAQFSLGVIYDQGRGVRRNLREAAKWYRRAAEQGVATAQFNLGVLLELGQGLPQNFEEARGWYELAADQGDADARNNLGALYQFGRGVEKNLLEAHKWFNLAAAAGLEEAKNNRDRVAGRLTLEQVQKAQTLASLQYVEEETIGWFALTLEDIVALQQALKDAGYNPGPIDGERGPLTESALAAYQTANDLPPGPPDQKALEALGVR